MTLKEMPKVGDKVRYIGKKGEFNSDVTYGNIYEITESYSGGVFFVDDTKEEESGIGEENFGMFELVTEQPVEASPSVIELLSNLALRLAKVEDKIGIDGLKPKEIDEMYNGTTTQSERIESVCNEVRDLLIRKNHDYGDSFSKQFAKYGVNSAMIRMDDKMRRLETLLSGEQAQVAESIEDSIADLAGYALLALVELRK